MGYKANITSNLINQVIRIGIGLLTSVLVARALGPLGQGYTAYIILIFTLLGTYGHLGLNNAVMYFQKRSSFAPDSVFRTNLTALGLIFLILSTGMILLRASEMVLADYDWFFIGGGLVFMLADFVFTNHHSWFIGDERIRQSNRYNITVFILKSAAILVLWILDNLTVYSFFAVQVVAMLLNAVLLHVKLGRRWRPELNTALLKAEFRYGGIIYLGALFAFLHYRVDQFMIKLMLGTPELGVYAVAVNIAELLFLIPISVSSALSGRLYNSDAQTGRQLMAQTLKLSFYICAALSLAGIPASFLIPYVYGRAFAGAVASTVILLLGVLFASIAKVMGPYFFSKGRPGFHLLITFVTLLLNTALNLLLIPVFGIAGASLASSASYLVYGLFYVYLFIKVENYPLAELLSLKRSDLLQLWRRT